MKKTPTSSVRDIASDDMLPEYSIDYSKSRPNRFAGQIGKDQRAVILDPDIAEVFTTSASVNTVLRALIVTMPPVASKQEG